MAKHGRKVRCKHCGDIIQSMHRHDFKRCECGKIFVDGGGSYLRLGFPSEDPDDDLEVLATPDETKKEEE